MRLRQGGRAATARWAARWRKGCELWRVRRQNGGGSAVEMTRCGSYGAQGLDGAHHRAAGGGAGGGGGARPVLALLTTKSPTSFFSCVIKSR